MVTTHQTQVSSCPGGGDRVGRGRQGEESLPYAAVAEATEEVEVDEVKMEAEDHLAREYVQEFVLDHLDPADVKREVSTPCSIIFWNP